MIAISLSYNTTSYNIYILQIKADQPVLLSTLPKPLLTQTPQLHTPVTESDTLRLYIYIEGILLTLLSKVTYNLSFTHSRRSQPRRTTAGSSGAVRVRLLTQGHLDTPRVELATFRLQVNPRVFHCITFRVTSKLDQ